MRIKTILWCLLVTYQPCGAEQGDIPVLRSGSLVVPQYEVNKAYSRHLDLEKKSRCHASLVEWYPSYANEVMATAKAKDMGYYNRREVVEGVYRMERNMLANPALLMRESLADVLIRLASDHEARAIILVSRVIVDVGVTEMPRLAPPIQFQQAFAFPVVSYEHGLVLSETDCPDAIRAELLAANAGECRVENIDGERLAIWRKDSAVVARSASEFNRAFADATQRNPAELAKLWTSFVERTIADYAPNESALATHGTQLLAALNGSPEVVLSPELGPQTLFSYTYEGVSHKGTFALVMDFYRRQFFKPKLTSVDDLKPLFRESLVEEYGYHFALAFGLHHPERFQLDKAAYRNALALEIYLRDEIDPSLDLSEVSMRNWYEQHPEPYTKAAWVEMHVHSFDSRQNALAAFGSLNSSNSADHTPGILGGLRETRAKVRLGYGDARLDARLRSLLWSMPMDRTSPPLLFDGHPTLFTKLAQGGSIVEPFETVKGRIHRTMLNQGRAVALKQHVTRMGPEYEVLLDPNLTIDKLGPVNQLIEPLAHRAAKKRE